ncbi:Cilia- and flagella-associated protein 20 [Mortierella sp. AD094]|nr:Cilia- and flagella-associated protein 20 [Mortierella sp. AD094]
MRVGPPPTSESSKSKESTPASSASITPASNEANTPSTPLEPHVEFLIDDTLNSKVLELLSTNLPSTFITTPSLPTRTLGIKLPYLVFLVKNLGKYWSFEVTILDDRGEKRRFRASNFQTSTRVKPYITTMPLRMDPGWNQIQLNLADYTKRAYGTTYIETQRITVHANCRIRRIYFSDRLVQESDLPAEFKLYLPVVK